MQTLLKRLPTANPDSAGLTPISVSQDEIDLMAADELLHWWDAGHGFDAEGWRCRKTGKMLTKERTNMPQLQPALAAYHGAPSLLFPNGNYELWDGGQNLFPAGEFTMAVVGRAGPNDNAFMCGAATVGLTQTTRYQFAGTTGNGSQNLTVSDATATAVISLNGPTPTHFFEGGPVLVEMSHRQQPILPSQFQGFIRRMRVDTGFISESGGNTVAGETSGNTHREFHVGAVNPFGSSAGGAIEAGDIGSIFLFSTALHYDISLRALLERVVRARYAIPVA
ncbi:hypothetical protein CP98_04980 [Sphingobium yanoikuyae]|uniref:Uncharacterized protein n=1 Tax=Sphingobium yanoikuyae TaxID=13690 RepID=A0A084E6D3_SPHYA|nr:hypothetical protein [Sphingobium yanoikuyae]KEZ13525.1 hypothetical protein CP98_04980 [Sphingobium yanoikuyae]